MKPILAKFAIIDELGLCITKLVQFGYLLWCVYTCNVL